MKFKRFLENDIEKAMKGLKRYQGIAGKFIGGQLYVHKDYASEVIPQDLLEKAKSIVGDYPHNCIMYHKAKNVIRFDTAEGFDTEREPLVGDFRAVRVTDGMVKDGKTNTIWHHKWLWVKDDYKGFDVTKSVEWSKVWYPLLKSNKTIASGYPKTWVQQLEQFNLPIDTNLRYK